MSIQSLSQGRAYTSQISLEEERFNSLSPREKLYAHHLARAVWHGSRIVLRQTSPEAIGIFDFILELHKACGGEWDKLVDQDGVSPDDLDEFLEFAGMFLSRQGNYWVGFYPIHSCVLCYFTDNCQSLPIGKLSRMFRPMLSARWQASRRTLPLL